MIDNSIDTVIQRREVRTVELNRKYEWLNLDDINNLKSDATAQLCEGKGFPPGVGLLSHVVTRILNYTPYPLDK